MSKPTKLQRVVGGPVSWLIRKLTGTSASRWLALQSIRVKRQQVDGQLAERWRDFFEDMMFLVGKPRSHALERFVAAVRPEYGDYLPLEYLIEKGRQNLAAAKRDLEIGMPALAASRAYYAMFHTTEAALASAGLAFGSHSAVIAAFGKDFASRRCEFPSSSRICPRHRGPSRVGLGQRLPPKLHRELVKGFQLHKRAEQGLAGFRLSPGSSRIEHKTTKHGLTGVMVSKMEAERAIQCAARFVVAIESRLLIARMGDAVGLATQRMWGEWQEAAREWVKEYWKNELGGKVQAGFSRQGLSLFNKQDPRPVVFVGLRLPAAKAGLQETILDCPVGKGPQQENFGRFYVPRSRNTRAFKKTVGSAVERIGPVSKGGFYCEIDSSAALGWSDWKRSMKTILDWAWNRSED